MLKKLLVGVVITVVLTACDQGSERNYSAGENSAGPFGISMGMTEEYLRKSIPSFMKAGNNHTFASEQAIVENPSFDIYRYILTEKTGVCQIAASTRLFATYKNGDQIKSKFAWVSDLVKTKYGEPHLVIDKAEADSLYDSSIEFTKALQYGEYNLIHQWDAIEQGKSFPNNIAKITVVAQAPSAYDGRVIVSYEFTNKEECQLAIRRQASIGM